MPRRQQRDGRSSGDSVGRGWDERRGQPRDARTVEKVEQAYSRYSASEQSEEKRRRRPARATRKPIATGGERLNRVPGAEEITDNKARKREPRRSS